MRLRSKVIAAIAIVGIDYFVYVIIFTVAYLVVVFIGLSVQFGNLGIGFVVSSISKIFSVMEEMGASMFLPHSIDFSFIFFWAGFAPSLWMWLYVAVLSVTRLLLQSEKLVNWLRWFLDVEKNPFRSIGAVAAALAFIASVAIILVSAEVSRISTAL